MDDYKEVIENENRCQEDPKSISTLTEKFSRLETDLYDSYKLKNFNKFHSTATEIYNLFFMDSTQLLEEILNGILDFLVQIIVDKDECFLNDALYIISGICNMQTSDATNYFLEHDDFLQYLNSVNNEYDPLVISSVIHIIYSIIYDCIENEIETPFIFNYELIHHFYEICPSAGEQILAIIASIFESGQYSDDFSSLFDLAKTIIIKGGNVTVIISAFLKLIHKGINIFEHVELSEFFQSAIFPLLNSNDIENVEITLKLLSSCLIYFNDERSKEISINSPINTICELVQSTNEKNAIEATIALKLILFYSQSIEFFPQELEEFLIEVAEKGTFKESYAAIGVLLQVLIIGNSEETKCKLMTAPFIRTLISRIDHENPKTAKEPLELLARLCEIAGPQTEPLTEALSDVDVCSFMESIEAIRELDDLPEEIQTDTEIVYTTIASLVDLEI